MSQQHLFILTATYRGDYDQHGDYFWGAWPCMPTVQQLQNVIGEHIYVTHENIEHLIETGACDDVYPHLTLMKWDFHRQFQVA